MDAPQRIERLQCGQARTAAFCPLRTRNTHSQEHKAGVQPTFQHIDLGRPLQLSLRLPSHADASASECVPHRYNASRDNHSPSIFYGLEFVRLQILAPIAGYWIYYQYALCPASLPLPLLPPVGASAGFPAVY
jgi:hypothetical protein